MSSRTADIAMEIYRMSEDATKQLEELLSEIQRHNYLYFNQSSPEISDTEYDELVEEARGIVRWMDMEEPNNELIAVANETFDSVGAEVTFGTKVKHPSLMGSLSKAYTVEELLKWAKQFKCGIAVTPKVDGLAVRIEYRQGKLHQAATRGDGTMGVDVTANVREIKRIPKTISIKTPVTLYGEIYMTRSDFDNLCRVMVGKGEKPKANPRNAASGSLLQKNAKITGERSLSFLCYDVVAPDEAFNNAAKYAITEGDKREWMAANIDQIDFVPTDRYMPDESEFKATTGHWDAQRRSLNYGIDGIVFSCDILETQESLGWKSGCPVGKIAFKFKATREKTTVNDITWQVGRTGRITPVAEVVPTLIDGSTVSRITLHNFAMVLSKNVRIGSEVLFEKAGDIIPQVVKVLSGPSGADKTSKYINYPNECPTCGTPTTRDTVNVLCPNDLCQAKIERNIQTYIDALDIKGVGKGIVRMMLKNDIIAEIPDLYNIDMGELAAIEGFGKRSAEIVVRAVLQKHTIELWRFLRAMGIEGAGKTVSKAVAQEFKTLECVRNCSAEVLCKIDGVGDTTAKALEHGLVLRHDMIEKLLQCVDIMEVETMSGSLDGKSFCVTGKLSRKRNEIHTLIEVDGGTVKSSVGKGLDYLVAGENVGATKTDKAAKYGTQVISEDDLMEMLGK